MALTENELRTLDSIMNKTIAQNVARGMEERQAFEAAINRLRLEAPKLAEVWVHRVAAGMAS